MVFNASPHLVLNETFIIGVNTQRHLWVYLTSNLDLAAQINDFCFRTNRKLSILRHVKMLVRNTVDIFYEITVRSVVDNAIPVYANI